MSRPTRLALQFLESRVIPSIGGGFTGGGIQGEYFNNANLGGLPTFARRDVRVDFDWQLKAPGGSNSPNYRQVGADNFSVRWTGQLIARFSETYTFKTTSDDGVRVWIRPTGSADWMSLIDHWTVHAAANDNATFALTAGKAYDLRMEYFDASGSATARLLWSSPARPKKSLSRRPISA